MKATCVGDYKGKGTKTLSVFQGDVVEVIQITTEAWTYVRDSQGKRGFIPTELLSIKGQDGRPLRPVDEEEGGVEMSKEKGRSGRFHLEARMVTEYEAETHEALSAACDTLLQVLQVGVEWTFVRNSGGERGFVPTALLRVDEATLLSFAMENGLLVVERDDSTEESESEGDESDVEEFRAAKSVTLPLDPQGSVIPLPVWAALPPAQQDRQRVIYGIIHRELNYNRDLWQYTQVARDFMRMNERRQFLSSDEADILFRHVASLYSTSSRFLSALLSRQRRSVDGVVDSIADLLGAQLNEFQYYVLFASKTRQEQGTRIFREYLSQFDHPFSRFLHKLPHHVRLQQLFALPGEYMHLWPYLLRNLLRDTSKSRQRQEYRHLRKLHDSFSNLCKSMSLSEQDAARALRDRLENYDEVRPHIEGKKLLREIPGRAMSAEGVKYGNHVFLFDSCIVFARKLDRPRNGKEFRALKKLKMDRLRIVDVQRANLIVRYNSSKYFISMPSKGDAVEWSHLIRHKGYRSQLEVDLFKQDEWDQVVLPNHEKRYEDHLARVTHMQQHINDLMRGESMAIEGSSSEGRSRRLRLRAPKNYHSIDSEESSGATVEVAVAAERSGESFEAPVVVKEEKADDGDVDEDEDEWTEETYEETITESSGNSSVTPPLTWRSPRSAPVNLEPHTKPCIHCSTALKETASFCLKCGKSQVPDGPPSNLQIILGAPQHNAPPRPQTERETTQKQGEDSDDEEEDEVEVEIDSSDIESSSIDVRPAKLSRQVSRKLQKVIDIVSPRKQSNDPPLPDDTPVTAESLLMTPPLPPTRASVEESEFEEGESEWETEYETELETEYETELETEYEEDSSEAPSVPTITVPAMSEEGAIADKLERARIRSVERPIPVPELDLSDDEEFSSWETEMEESIEPVRRPLTQRQSRQISARVELDLSNESMLSSTE